MTPAPLPEKPFYDNHMTPCPTLDTQPERPR